MGWSAELHVRRYFRIARESTLPLREQLQARNVGLRAALVFLGHGLISPTNSSVPSVLEHAAEKKLSSEELQRELLRINKTARKRLAPPREPLKNLKNGGFVVRTIRLDAHHPSGIHRGIDVLKNALRKAR